MTWQREAHQFWDPMIASLPEQCRLVEQPGLGQQELQLYTSKHQSLSLLDWESSVNSVQGSFDLCFQLPLCW